MRYVEPPPADAPRIRLGILGVVSVSLFLALFTRLWFIQVMAAPEFQQAAESNRVRLVNHEAPRGRILDRNGKVIVDNRTSATVVIDRKELALLDPDLRRGVLDRTAGLVGIHPDRIDELLDDVRFSPLLPLPIADDVSDEVVVTLRERSEQFPAVRVEQRLVREHPYGTVAAHLTGYVGEINDTELEERRALGYELGDGIGKAGIERIYDRDLKGSRGTSKMEVDSQGRVLRVLGERHPVPGRDVKLTIDIDLQALAERELADALARARDRSRRTPAPAGSVVVLDPRNGEILAMASYPTYDPREFVGGITTEQWERLQDPANRFPLNNWAVQGQYAPGSTFKLITATAALRAGLITPQSTIVDRGSYTLPQCRGRCTFRNAGSVSYGTVAVRRAITVSSDVFFYQLGAQFWLQRDTYGDGIQDTAQDYGFGVATGVDLPSEQPGVVPGPEVRAARHEANPEAFPEGRWFTGDNVNLAIGQGEMAVTPLQLANAYAQFSIGGARYVPHLVKEVVAPTGRIQHQGVPELAGQMELDPEHRQAILDGLRGVTAADGGTARAAFAGFPLDRFPVAGKTGTAEVRGSGDSALFAGFGPIDDPRYVVVAVLEEAGFGGTAAAPLVRSIFEPLAEVEDLPPAPRSG